MRALRDVGFTGQIRSDHGPAMRGEENQNGYRPGYGFDGRFGGLMYLKGLADATWRY
jgi:mannonate dehydratase